MFEIQILVAWHAMTMGMCPQTWIANPVIWYTNDPFKVTFEKKCT